MDASQLPDDVYHDLISVLEIAVEQREQVQPTLSFSEAQHTQDQTNTILERLENIQHIVGRIVGQEEMHRRKVATPSKAWMPEGCGPDS